MKILNRNLARSLWFFATEELNPLGLDLIPIYAAIQSRYKFQSYPNKPEDIAVNGIKYQRGTFRLDDAQQIEIAELTIYNDGIVAATRHSTAGTDQFLADLLLFVSENYRLSFDEKMVQKKAYVSELTVTTDFEIDSINQNFRRFCCVLAAATGENVAFSPIAVKFGTDPGASGAQLLFSFERRDGRSFDLKQYFTTAPLSSEKHIEVLEAFQELLVGLSSSRPTT